MTSPERSAERNPERAARSRRVRIAILRDAREAERWQAALQAAGVDARVEIEDLQRALPGETIPGIFGAAKDGFAMFAYPVSIRAADRQRAAPVLIDLGWDGLIGGGRRRPVDAPSGGRLRFALLALGAGVVALLVRLALA